MSPIYLGLHLGLQVSPVDSERCAVRAGGARRRQSGEPAGRRRGAGRRRCPPLQERGGEGDCISSAHPLTPHSHTLSMV